MAKRGRKFQLFIVSVDFATNRRPQPPYSQLETFLSTLGGVITPTHQIRLLLSPFSAVKIRDDIKAAVLRAGDRVYVGKIAKDSAWHNLLKITNARLKAILKTFAKGAKPEMTYVTAARKAIKGLLPM
jgi:hypothetical protein